MEQIIEYFHTPVATVIWLLTILVLILGLVTQFFRQRSEFVKQLAQQSEQQLGALFNQTAFGVIVLNPDGVIERSNDVFANMVGAMTGTVAGKSLCEMMHPEDLEDFKERMEALKKDPSANAVREKRIRKEDGEYVWTLLSCAYVAATNKIVGQVIDISDRKDAEDTIYQLAYYDTLTGLPNRLHFNDHSKKMLERARENKWRFAVFLVDLDNFKAVNDTYGHHIGDALLKEIAIRLDSVIASRCESEEHCRCFCARLGGDEFVLVIERLEDAKDATMIAEWIFGAFKDPIVVGPHELFVSLSIGVSIYPYDGQSVSSLLRSADLALYTAKDKGKNTFFFHDVSMNQRFEEQVEYQTIIRYFLETKDFDLLYQPILDVRTGKVSGVEALLGGNKIKYPRIDIQNLIMVAEDTGAIIDLGLLILEKACRGFVRDIQPICPKGFGMSVNVSVRQIEDPHFVAKFAGIVHETRMPPENLILEVTETAMATHLHDVSKKLHKLTDIGIRVAIDDFGKGYSSMSHLRQVHAQKLKIDKTLTDDLTHDKGKEIVRTIILMCQALEMSCVAEGVENDSTFRILRELDCDEVQGYLISPSLLLPDFKRYLALSVH